MKKLLAVATIAVVGYKVVKKIKERKNEEAEMDYIIDKFEKKYKEYINEVEEEIVVDNDEETIQVEDVEVVDEEKVNIINGIKNIIKKTVKYVIKGCIGLGYKIGRLFNMIHVNLIKLANSERYELNHDLEGWRYELDYHCKNIELYLYHYIDLGVKLIIKLTVIVCMILKNIYNNLL